jgi:hypothetical protein
LLLVRMQHHHHHVPCPLSCFGCKLYSRFASKALSTTVHKNTSKYGHPWTDTVINVSNVRVRFKTCLVQKKKSFFFLAPTINCILAIVTAIAS